MSTKILAFVPALRVKLTRSDRAFALPGLRHRVPPAAGLRKLPADTAPPDAARVASTVSPQPEDAAPLHLRHQITLVRNVSA